MPKSAEISKVDDRSLRDVGMKFDRDKWIKIGLASQVVMSVTREEAQKGTQSVTAASRHCHRHSLEPAQPIL